MPAPAAYSQEPLNHRLNTLAGLDGSYGAAYAANVWAGTTGLSLVAALNVKAGTKDLALAGVLNKLAGTTGLGEDEAARRIVG